ncbi:MAG: fimbria major subunit [Muribaculaceae bacterium]|nr:fimbria major subunit [Muribaculaceae bacterium]
MKKIYGFAALCAAMTLASCSNNDEPIVPDSSVPSKASGLAGYLSVNIANADKGTRANHNDFVYGSDAESKATHASFLYFDANGNFLGISKSVALTATTTPDTNGENVERDYTVMVPVEVDYTPSTNADEEEAAKENRDKKDAAVKNIAQVIAVLNPGGLDDYLDGSGSNGAAVTIAGESKTDKAIGTIYDVMDVIRDYATTDLTGASKFVMSNSVYWDTTDASNPKLVYGASCLDENEETKIKTNKAEAVQTPVSIYVERVVARVDAEFGDDFLSTYTEDAKDPKKVATGAKLRVFKYDKTTETYTYDDIKLDIKVKGIEIANMAKHAYLVKNLGNATANPFQANVPFANWNSSTNYRSHWAVGTSATVAPSRKAADQNTSHFYNKAYNGFNNNFTFTGNAETNSTFKNQYLNENLSDYNTAVVVSAELVYADGEKEGEAVEFVRVLKNAKYYETESAKLVLLDMLQREGYMVKEVTPANGTDSEKVKYVSIKPDDVAFKSANNLGYDGYLQLTDAIIENDNRSIVKVTNIKDEGTGAYSENIAAQDNDVFNNYLATTADYKVWKWTEGKCYYYVELYNGETMDKPVKDKDGNVVKNDDESIKTYNDKAYGIVRNHIYALTLRTMVGLGVPVFDPTEIIVPVTPPHVDEEDDDWQMACDIHILSWARYHQDVNFNNGQDNY